MKTKTKKLKQKVRQYEPHFLALILVAVLLFEGFTISATTKTDWQYGLQVLDMSGHITQTVSDMQITFQPIIDTVTSVKTFYEMAADEAMVLFDLSDTNVLSEINMVTGGVAEFYNVASLELAELLDFSEVPSLSETFNGVFLSSY